jgi:hypothetical protein
VAFSLEAHLDIEKAFASLLCLPICLEIVCLSGNENR